MTVIQNIKVDRKITHMLLMNNESANVLRNKLFKVLGDSLKYIIRPRIKLASERSYTLTCSRLHIATCAIRSASSTSVIEAAH